MQINAYFRPGQPDPKSGLSATDIFVTSVVIGKSSVGDRKICTISGVGHRAWASQFVASDELIGVVDELIAELTTGAAPQALSINPESLACVKNARAILAKIERCE